MVKTLKAMKDKANKAIINMQTGAMVAQTKPASRNARIKGVILTALCMTALLAICAFADPDVGEFGTVVDGIKGGLGNIFATIRNITVPIAAVSLVFCGIAYFWCGEKGMESGKQWAKRIMIGLALVGLAPILLTAIYSVFEQSTGTVFN